MRLSPRDPLIGWMQVAIAHAHVFAGRYDVASSWAEMALRDRPDHLNALRIAAASNALAGRLEQARKALDRLRQLDPAPRVAVLSSSKNREKPTYHRSKYRSRVSSHFRPSPKPQHTSRSLPVASGP